MYRYKYEERRINVGDKVSRSPTLSKSKKIAISKMSKDEEKTSSVKEIPFHGKRDKYKEWETRMLTLAETQG